MSLEARKNYRVLLQLWGAMPLKNCLVLFACVTFPTVKMASRNVSAEDVMDEVFFFYSGHLQCFGWLRYSARERSLEDAATAGRIRPAETLQNLSCWEQTRPVVASLKLPSDVDRNAIILLWWMSAWAVFVGCCRRRQPRERERAKCALRGMIFFLLTGTDVCRRPHSRIPKINWKRQPRPAGRFCSWQLVQQRDTAGKTPTAGIFSHITLWIKDLNWPNQSCWLLE